MRFWPVLILLVASAAFAAPKKPTVVLSGHPAVTRWVSKELSKKYAPVTARSQVSALPTAKEVRDVTAPVGGVALVLCQVAGAYVTLQVLNGADGTPLDTISIKASPKKLPRTMAKPNLAALLFAVANGKAPGKEAAQPPPPVEKKEVEPVAEEPKKSEPVVTKKKEREAPPPVEKKEEEPPAVAEETPPSEPLKPSPQPALRLGVGVGGFNRNLTWAGNPSPSLARADMPFSGDISVEASWYPAAHFTSNFLANIGLFGSADFGVGMVSRPRQPREQGGASLQESRFAHSASRIRFGGLVRLPIGERFTLNAHLGYSRHEVTTSRVAVNDGSARPNIPDVLFNGFRAGLGMRLRIAGTVELDVSGAFQTVAGKGELSSSQYFPRASAFAVDAGGGLSVGVVGPLRLRLGAEWQRYFVTLNAEETSTFFAGSAADQYITATASLQWVM